MRKAFPRPVLLGLLASLFLTGCVRQVGSSPAPATPTRGTPTATSVPATPPSTPTVQQPPTPSEVKISHSTVAELREIYHLETYWVDDLAWSPDGQRFAVVAWPDASAAWPEAQMYDADTGELLWSQEVLASDGLEFGPDGDNIALLRYPYGLISIDATTGKIAESYDPENPCGGGVLAFMGFAVGGDIVVGVSGMDDPDWPTELYAWSASSGECLGALFQVGSDPRSASFDPDGRLLAIGRYAGDQPPSYVVEVWDLESRSLRCTTAGSLVEFNHAGDLLAVHDRATGSVSVVDPGTCEKIRAFENLEPLQDLAFSRDDSMLAAAAGRIFVWDSQTGSLLANLRGTEGGVRELEFSPDGRFLLTASSTAGSDRISLWAVAED